MNGQQLYDVKNFKMAAKIQNGRLKHKIIVFL